MVFTLPGNSWQEGIGLGWKTTRDQQYTNFVGHGGGTAGHTAFIGFIPKQKVGVIALTNCGKMVDGIARWLLHTAIELMRGPQDQEGCARTNSS